MYLYENKKKNGIWKSIGLVFVTIILTVVFMQYVPDLFANNKSNDVQRLSEERKIEEQPSSDNNTKSTVDIVESNMKSVVGVSVLQPDSKSLFDVNVAQKWGIGTGIVLSENGYILTNQHLAKNKNFFGLIID